MRVLNSACISVLFPKSRKSIDEFKRTAEFLAGRGVKGIEFFYDGDHPERVGGILADNGLDGIFIVVIPSKEGKLWLCDTDDDRRAAAVKMATGYLDYARDNGMEKVMINSGRPDGDIAKGLDALAASVGELFEHAEKTSHGLKLCLEPCDDNMEAFHLIGPYRRAVDFVQRVQEEGYPLTLTMDAAHTAETGEDFVEAMRAAKPYCNHVHFANCNISQPDNPLYGDKHLGFEYPDSVWTPETLARLYGELEKLYPGDEELRIGIEILCREDDPFAYYEKTWNMLPFMH